MTDTPATRAARLLGAAALALCAGAACAQPPAPPPAAVAAAPTPPADYRNGANWLCRPGRQDACGGANLTTTRVSANGALSPMPYAAAAAPAVDCFYVYPTVSHDPTANSDLNPGPEERGVVQQQFARFGSVCRTYAPMYRQVTLSALRAAMTGQPMAGTDRELPYQDVRAAFRDYMAHDNGGRGFVLIGHSQGSGVLTRLIKEEIDGKPIQKQMVSAILGGTSLAVPPGADVGGAFQSTPLCRKPGQTGCVVAFASFRATSPPPPNSRFGRIAQVPGGPPVAPGMAAACVNPAAPGGGRAELHPFMTASGQDITAAESAPQWVAGQPPLKTAFAYMPGLYTAECVSEGGFNYLSIRIDPDPADVRREAAERTGDVVANGVMLKDWGLHLIDMNLTMGDMTRLVREQATAYLKGR